MSFPCSGVGSTTLSRCSQSLTEPSDNGTETLVLKGEIRERRQFCGRRPEENVSLLVYRPLHFRWHNTGKKYYVHNRH